MYVERIFWSIQVEINLMITYLITIDKRNDNSLVFHIVKEHADRSRFKYRRLLF